MQGDFKNPHFIPTDGTTDTTTDETTSHSAMPPKNGGQAAGYSPLTKLANYANLVTGYELGDTPQRRIMPAPAPVTLYGGLAPIH